MRRLLVTLVGAAAALALSAGSTMAIVVPGTLDQEQAVTTASVSVNSTVDLAETFTAGVTGSLTAVAVYVNAQAAPVVVGPAAVTPPPGSNFGISVVPTSGGLPNLGGTPLMGPAFATVGTTAGWQYFTLDTPAPITSGTKYAIVVNAIGSGLALWAGDCTNVYAGGEALALDTVSSPTWRTVVIWNDGFCMQDFAIRTYISTATPAPTITVPPTATIAASATSNSSPLPILVAIISVTAAAAFVSLRRHGLARR